MVILMINANLVMEIMAVYTIHIWDSMECYWNMVKKKHSNEATGSTTGI